MNIFKNIWAWLARTAPDEEETALRIEYATLVARFNYVTQKLAAADQQRAYIVAERLITSLREKRRTPWTESELAFLRTFAPREDCPHLKGASMVVLGPGGRIAMDKYGTSPCRYDYNISDHTYIGGERVIKCLTCGKKWTKDSPDWGKAVEMSEASSNKPSSSERVARTL